MKKLHFLIVLGTALVLSCGKEQGQGSPYTAISETAKTINGIVQPVFVSSDSSSIKGQLETLKAEIMSLPKVTEVSVYDDVVAVRFEGDYVRFWEREVKYDYSGLDTIELAYDFGKQAIGNKRCLIINQLGFWEINAQSFPALLVQKLRNLLENNGWQVTVVSGTDVSLDFYKTGLAGYDLVFWNAHGKVYPNLSNSVWIASNTISSQSTNNAAIQQMADDHLITDGYIGSNAHILIGPEFLEKYYPNSSQGLYGSMFYLSSCNGMTYTGFADGLRNAGAFGVVGWKGENQKGPKIGYHMVKLLLEGYSLRAAFDALGASDKTDNCLPCGEPLYNAATMHIVPEGTAASGVYLNGGGQYTFAISNSNWQWGTLNTCYMSNIDKYGSNVTLRLSYPSNITLTSALRFDLFGKFSDGYLDHDYGYGSDSWVTVNTFSKTIDISLCVHFGNTDYVDQSFVVSQGSYRSNMLTYRLYRPIGANKENGAVPPDQVMK